MGTSSLIALVEALHLDLKDHRVKKNAIEAKLREICVKDQRHIWSVKADTEVCCIPRDKKAGTDMDTSHLA
jgi:chromatin assembly factor 1 subunit A